MEYGSIFGHGAYLGPDFTADYLHRPRRSCSDQLGGSGSDAARQQTVDEFQANRYDSDDRDAPVLPPAQARAFERARRATTATFFDSRATQLRAAAERRSTIPTEIHAAHRLLRLVGLGGASARRPGQTTPTRTTGRPRSWSATRPTADAIVWSALSLIALLGGHRAALRRLRALERPRLARARAARRSASAPPGDVALTPAQRATAWFFLVMAALFLLQTLVGGATAALPRRARRLLRDRPGRRCSPTT